MLPTSVAQVGPELNLHLSPHDSPSRAAPPPAQPSKCNAQTCPWWPYSSSQDFRTNTALILTILFCALLSALAVNAAIRYILRRHRRRDIESGEEQKPPNSSNPVELEAIPTWVFSPGMKLGGAEAECTICLSELVEGDVIRVLERCSHGFHVHCIQQWLASHPSCPTCRANCLPRPPAASVDDRNRLPENAAEG